MNTLLGFPEGGFAPAFGRLLRQWRTSRHMSQLKLATESGISTRHLSFLETGRAQPSREMVQLLAGMLDVPLAERNMLLVSAGYAPIYGDRPLGAPELEPVRRSLQFILTQQEPFPALVLDGQWNVVMRNDAARRTFELFRGPLERVNVMRSVFDPNAIRPFIVNWEELAECLMHSLNREVAATGSEGVVRLRDEPLAYPGVPPRWRTASVPTANVAAGRHAFAKERPVDVVLLDDHHARHAARRRAPAAQDRVLLPGRCGHRTDGAPPGVAAADRRLIAVTSGVIATAPALPEDRSR
jgi:transcriptional regulator with XRE-family HTH domain